MGMALTSGRMEQSTRGIFSKVKKPANRKWNFNLGEWIRNHRKFVKGIKMDFILIDPNKGKGFFDFLMF